MEPSPDRPPKSASRIEDVPSALDHWPEIAALFEDRPTMVFLDFDGTLAPIVDQPDAAALLPGTGELIARLVALVPVAVVSGRGTDDVRPRIGVDGVHFAGSHGFEILTAEGTHHDHPEAAAAQPELEIVQATLAEGLRAVDGVVIEPKRFGLTVHDRMVAPEHVGLVHRVTTEVAAKHPSLRITRGKRVTEFRPDVDWDKGRAVTWLLHELHLTEALAVYVGDDRTDEDAFAALGPEALTVVVADPNPPPGDAARTTLARFKVDNPGQVQDLLGRLAALLEQHQPSSAY